MVFVAVSKFRKTNPIFVDRVVTINDTHCRDVLLSEQLVRVMREISGEFFIFQQDSVAAHRSCKKISLLEWDSPAFISSYGTCGSKESTSEPG